MKLKIKKPAILLFFKNVIFDARIKYYTYFCIYKHNIINVDTIKIKMKRSQVLYANQKILRLFTYETNDHYSNKNHINYTKKNLKKILFNYINKYYERSSIKQFSNSHKLSKIYFKNKLNNYNTSNLVNISNLFKKIFLNKLYTSYFKILIDFKNTNYNYKSILSKMINNHTNKINVNINFIKNIINANIYILYIRSIFNTFVKIINKSNIIQLYSNIKFKSIYNSKKLLNINNYNNTGYSIIWTKRFKKISTNVYNIIKLNKKQSRYAINKNYFIFDISKYIYYKNSNTIYSKYLNLFYKNIINPNTLHNSIWKIDYTTTKVPLNINTYRLFNIKIIGYLSKYYLYNYNNYINNIHDNINIVKKKYNAYNKFKITIHNNNFNALYTFINTINVESVQYKEFGKFYNPIDLKLNNTKDILKQQYYIDTKLQPNKYNTIINKKQTKSYNNILLNILYNNIISSDNNLIINTKYKQYNIINKKVNLNIKLYNTRKKLIHSFLKSENKNNIYQFNKQTLFFNNINNNINIYNGIIQLYILFLLNMLPIIIQLILYKNEHTKNIINFYIIILHLYDYDKLLLKNINNLYFSKLMVILKNIDITSNILNKSKIYYLLNNIFSLINKLKKNSLVNNKNYKYLNVQLFNKKLFNKIMVSKLLYKYDINKVNIKQINYTSKTNILNINFKYKNETNLNSLSKHIFYMKSIEQNNDYNHYSKLDILYFKKAMYKLTPKKKYNEWRSFYDIFIDLITNYKTIHKTASVFDDLSTERNYYSKNELNNNFFLYLNPYPNNILRTIRNNDLINDNISDIIYALTGVEMQPNLLELDYTSKNKLDETWLLNYIKKPKILDKFTNSIYSVQRYLPRKMQQSSVDLVVNNFNLWKITYNSNINILYNFSYFNNELYYLDYIDYLFYKYNTLNTLLEIPAAYWSIKSLQNKYKKKSNLAALQTLHLNKMYVKNEFLNNGKINKYRRFKPQFFNLKKSDFLREEKKRREDKQYDKIKKSKLSWYMALYQKIKNNMKNAKQKEILKRKLTYQQATNTEVVKLKKKKKHIYTFMTKFKWDTNTYNPYLNLSFLNSISNIDPNKLYTSFNNMELLLPNVKEYIYMLSNLLNYSIDLTPFEISLLRELNLNNKSKKTKQIIKTIFSNLSGDDKLEKELHKFKNLLSLFEHKKVPINNKEINNNYYMVLPKMKIPTKQGINNIKIYPYYLHSNIKEEIYLYRKIISLYSEYKDVSILNAEGERYIKTIINLDSIQQFIDNLNYQNVNSNLLRIELYKKNISYYNLLITPTHTLYAENTMNILNNLFDMDYEYLIRYNKYIKRYLKYEDALINLKKDKNKYLNKKYKNHFFRYNINASKLFYFTINPQNKTEYLDGDYIINIISESNKKLSSYLYNINNDNIINPNEINNSDLIHINLNLIKLKNNIIRSISSEFKKITRINNVLSKLKLSSTTNSKYRYDLIQEVNMLIQNNIMYKLPITIILLFLSNCKLDTFHNNQINYNLFINAYDKLWLNKSTLLNNLNLTRVEINNNLKQLFDLIKSNKNLKSFSKKIPDVNGNINKFLIPTQQKITKYTKLYNLNIERRFLWYITKSFISSNIQNEIPYEIYNKIYATIWSKNKLTNSKIQLLNIDKIPNEFIKTDELIFNLIDTPHLYYVYNINKQYIYTPKEYTIDVMPNETNDQKQERIFYKSIPFNFDNIKKAQFMLMYIGRHSYYSFKTGTQYLTFPIELFDGNKNYFVRYKIHGSDDIQYINEISNKLNINNLLPYITYYRINKKNIIGDYNIFLYQDLYYNYNITKYDYQKIMYYNMHYKTNIGNICYLSDITKNTIKSAHLASILDIPIKNIKQIKYLYDDITDIYGNFHIGDDKTKPEFELVKIEEETVIHFFFLPDNHDTQNIILFKFLHKLFIKKNNLLRNEYTIKICDSKIAYLAYVSLAEPIIMIACFFLLGNIDSDSLNILKYNLLRRPKLNTPDLISWKSIPLGLFIEDDTIESLKKGKEFALHYLHEDFNTSLFTDVNITWPAHIDIRKMHTNKIHSETEPLKFIGIELNINPLFRMFTYNGWRIWKESMNILLLFQNIKHWNINYFTDIQIFNKLFNSMNFYNNLISSNVNELRTNLKTYNLYENFLPTYLNRYHYANDYKMFKEWVEYCNYGLIEYQRTMPENYHKLLTQWDVRLHLYYNFINSKEYELVTKRHLNHLLGSVYSMQTNPTDYEEFFTYPNKRIQQYYTKTQSILKKKSWLNNYSISKSEYYIPRTGYESYIYSYAYNIFYTHHNLITNPSFWNELYNTYTHHRFTSPDDTLHSFYLYRKIKYLDIFPKKIISNHIIPMLPEQIQNLFLKHKIYYYKKNVNKKMKRTYHQEFAEEYLSKTQSEKLEYGKHYGIFDALKDFFINNAVKLSDLNLLYTPNRYKLPIENNLNINLHPSIMHQYYIKNKYTLNNYINTSFIIYPTLKTNNMFSIHVMHTNTFMTEKTDFFKNLFNPIRYLLQDERPTISSTIRSLQWRSKFFKNSNAVHHENSYGPLWSIYNKNMMPTDKILNNTSLGIRVPTIIWGLQSFKHSMLSELDDEYMDTIIINDNMAIRGPTTLPLNVSDYPEIKFNYLSDIDDLVALFNYQHTSWDSNLYTLINLFPNELTHNKRAYTNQYMRMLHYINHPYSSYANKEFKAYIPIGYDLKTNNILNNNYIKMNHWYNPIFHRLNKRIYSDFTVNDFDFLRILSNPENIFDYDVHTKFLVKHTNIYKDKELNFNDNFINKIKHKKDNEIFNDLNIYSDYENITYSQLNAFNQKIQKSIMIKPLIDFINKYSKIIANKPTIITKYLINKQMNIISNIINEQINNYDAQLQNNNVLNLYDKYYYDDANYIRIDSGYDNLELEEIYNKVMAHRIYGHLRYPDIYQPMFQSYSPERQPHFINKLLNDSKVYLNRYNFINIYENFRILPFYYLKKKLISINQDNLTNVINHHINKWLYKINTIMYPLENQNSSPRSTNKLFFFEQSPMASMFLLKNNKAYRDKYIDILRNTWHQKYLNFYDGFPIFAQTNYTPRISYGFKPKRHVIFDLMDVLKLKWYNLYVQSTYQKPTKNFFPTNTLLLLSKTMNLRKRSNYDIKYNKYNNTLLQFAANLKHQIDLKNNRKQTIIDTPLYKESMKKIKDYSNNKELVNLNYNDITIQSEFIKLIGRKNASKSKIFIEKYGKRKRSKNDTERYILLNAYNKRFENPTNLELTKNSNVTPKTIITKHGNIHYNFNITRNIMEILSKYEKDAITSTLFIDSIEKGYDDHFKKILIKKLYTPSQKKQGLIVKKLILDYKPKLNQIFYTEKHPNISYNAISTLDTFGRTAIMDNKIYSAYSYKVYNYLKSKSMTLFNNRSIYEIFRPSKGEYNNIPEYVVSRIKPFKYSMRKHDLINHMRDLFNQKGNIPANNNNNQLIEPFSLTYSKILKQQERIEHIFNRNRFFMRTSRLNLADKEKINNQKLKGYSVTNYSDEEMIFKTSYWRYLSPKYLKNSIKYKTDEFVTYKSNSNTILDNTDSITQNLSVIRGSLFDKEYIYNYKVNYKKYSLPFVEYLYYTQFGIDNFNILKLSNFNILNYYIPTYYNDLENNIFPYLKKKNNNNLNKKNTLNANSEYYDHNIFTELAQYNFVIIKDNYYLYNNSIIRPITHWFVKIYYNNINYFDTFFSWCFDLISNIIII